MIEQTELVDKLIPLDKCINQMKMLVLRIIKCVFCEKKAQSSTLRWLCVCPFGENYSRVFLYYTGDIFKKIRIRKNVKDSLLTTCAVFKLQYLPNIKDFSPWTKYNKYKTGTWYNFGGFNLNHLLHSS